MGELAASRKRFTIETPALFGTNCLMNFYQFSHVDTWIFDLDNTLYPPKVRLFDQIEEKMRLFVADFLNVSLDEADVLRAQVLAEPRNNPGRHDEPTRHATGGIFTICA
jgi:putative hydrolase of the HAD superfamily